MTKKKIVFLTGTRADFGKLKSLIVASQSSKMFEVHVFVTGMHLNKLYGATVDEIIKSGVQNLYQFENQTSEATMDQTLAKTITGFSSYISELKPDLIIVHGDRVEAMAGAIVGSLNNILVGHIEGGELSGTIDDLIRHAVSKMSHIHFVSNESAKKRLLQLGEVPESIHVIGSPDIDVMNSKNLPSLEEVKQHYELVFSEYAIAMFHPVTTEINQFDTYARNFVNALMGCGLNFVVVYPNNDLGSKKILNSFNELRPLDRFRLYPSIRFEYFLTLLKNAQFIIGNSSAGVREAGFYNIPSINIGTRQNDRHFADNIVNTDYSLSNISEAISKILKMNFSELKKSEAFGKGKSDKHFMRLICGRELWLISQQKKFQDI